MNLVDRLLVRITEEQRPVVIVGDAMVDVWVHGRVAECQDGCQKFIEESRCERPGGAANAYRCLEHWPAWVSSYTGAPVCRKTRYLVDGRVLFRCDEDQTGSLVDQEVELLLKEVSGAGTVLLSDYDKGTLTESLIARVVASCRAAEVPCVADCKRAPEVYDGCLLKGNEEYWSKYPAPIRSEIVMTWGDRYPLLFPGPRPDFPSVRCVNHVGAGDCFAAHLALALACGFSLKEAAAIAHSAGRVYVQHPHNRPPRPTEIKADLLSAR